MRSATDLPVYERALEETGLQTMAAGGRGYWARQVVRDLCAWLAALANPRDEQQLYGVLASPLVGLSTDALALIARAGEGNAWRLIARAFGEGTEKPSPDRPRETPAAGEPARFVAPGPDEATADADAALFAEAQEPGETAADADAALFAAAQEAGETAADAGAALFADASSADEAVPPAPLDDPLAWLCDLAPDEDPFAEAPPEPSPGSPETGPDEEPETGEDVSPETGDDAVPEVDQDRSSEARLRIEALAAELPGLLGEADRERLAAFHARFATERRLLPRL